MAGAKTYHHIILVEYSHDMPVSVLLRGIEARRLKLTAQTLWLLT